MTGGVLGTSAFAEQRDRVRPQAGAGPAEWARAGLAVAAVAVAAVAAAPQAGASIILLTDDLTDPGRGAHGCASCRAPRRPGPSPSRETATR
jgi:hypothetical protein